jgi:hypothetical protein
MAEFLQKSEFFRKIQIKLKQLFQMMIHFLFSFSFSNIELPFNRTEKNINDLQTAIEQIEGKQSLYTKEFKSIIDLLKNNATCPRQSH